MPTIEVKISDLESLLEEPLTQERLEDLLMRVKGEVKDFLPREDAAKIELNDTNRPDLWSPEGIVRQIRPHRKPWPEAYPFFSKTRSAEQRIVVSEAVQAVRPYLAACTARGMFVTEGILTQLIQAQEKLADTFGRKRKTVSIGLYRLEKISFPVRYDLADPEKTAFVPLGFESEMSLKEVMSRHPKGLEYAETLAGAWRYPILVDAKGEILSFPPIINSQAIGAVEVGDEALLVEVTGTDLRMVMLALNIFACNLSDRGALISPVAIEYPKETGFGKAIQMPYDLSETTTLKLDELKRVLGESFEPARTAELLAAFGHQVHREDDGLRVTPPPYRDDVMHAIDLIEDVAIARGYEAFSPEMPSTFTVGALSKIERFSDAMRAAMIGFGFEELVSNILGSREDFVEKMRLDAVPKNRPEAEAVEIANPMTERFSLLRAWLLPALLRVEGSSSKAFYPHRIFEVGEIARMAKKSTEGTETLVHLAAMIAHPKANFSELHAILEALFYRLKTKSQLEPFVHPSFIEGRSGKILLKAQEVGFIGEVSPEVLSAWQIGMPCVAFEVALEKM